MSVFAHLPLTCPVKDIDHSTNLGMVCHGTVENPVLVKEQRAQNGEFIDWEYKYIAGELGYYHRCTQQLLELSEGKCWADRVVVRTPNGTHHAFTFDITAQHNAQLNQFAEVMKNAGLCPKCGNDSGSLHSCS